MPHFVIIFLLYLECLSIEYSVIFVGGFFFFFKQKTAYEMRISDWSSDVCSSDLQENWQKSAGWRKSLGHQVLLFDPLDPHGLTARFNPFSHINRGDPVEVIDELQKIAAMLWPPPANGESFWMDSARTAFIGVASYIAATEELPFTMGEVYRNLSA